MPEVQLSALPYLPSSLPFFSELADERVPVWLDSGKPLSDYGRYDIISANPVAVLSATHSSPSAQFLKEVEESLAHHFATVSAPQGLDIPFIGGAIGYLNYEFQHDQYKLPCTHNNPVAEVGIYDWAIVQDHHLKQSYLITHPNWPLQKVQYLHARLSACAQAEQAKQRPPFVIDKWNATTKAQDYLTAIATIQDYISAGDAYQVNYSQQFSANYTGHPLNAYIKMRQAVPSPYSACLMFPTVNILSVSPEKFVSVKNNAAITQPIKGTAARGDTPQADEQLANELLLSEKNRAENLMIVDLLRNDFSKNCEPHSVKTTKLFDLESYANVHHLVSTVTGKVKTGVSALNFLSDCFPGGSITGAPKKRSMEIINQLEPHARHIYCGSIFYLSAHGDLDSNIAIRTALLDNNTIYCCGGGGIVADSDAGAEFDESIQKIDKFLAILK